MYVTEEVKASSSCTFLQASGEAPNTMWFPWRCQPFFPGETAWLFIDRKRNSERGQVTKRGCYSD